MKAESANTPLLLQAVQIYTYTFGLIPPVFADIVINSRKSITIKYYYKHESSFNRLYYYWALFIIFAGLFGGTLILIVVVKKVICPTTTTLYVLETIVFVGFLSSGLLLLILVILINKYRELISLINDFIENGCHLGKFIKIK